MSLIGPRPKRVLYIENWTPWLDLKIVAMTFPAPFGRRGGN